MSLFAAQGADSVAPLGWVMGLTTAWFLLAFIGWAVWAWLPRNEKQFEEASRLPLEDA